MEINKEALRLLSNFDDGKPVFMLNYLAYKTTVLETGKTGKETYKEYLNAAAPFFQQIKAVIIFKGTPLATLIGPSEEKIWDDLFIVKYESKKEFFKLMDMTAYPSDIRASALLDSRLIFCK
jgi:hypothetical protein